MNDLVFGGWDIYEDTAYEAAVNAKVLEPTLLDAAEGAALGHQADEGGVRSRIHPPHQRSQRQDQGQTKMDKAEMLMDDIAQFRKTTGASRLVMIWCGSTEVFHRAAAVHQTLESFRRAGCARTIRRSRPARFTRTRR